MTANSLCKPLSISFNIFIIKDEFPIFLKEYLIKPIHKMKLKINVLIIVP